MNGGAKSGEVVETKALAPDVPRGALCKSGEGIEWRGFSWWPRARDWAGCGRYWSAASERTGLGANMHDA